MWGHVTHPWVLCFLVVGKRCGRNLEEGGFGSGCPRNEKTKMLPLKMTWLEMMVFNEQVSEENTRVAVDWKLPLKKSLKKPKKKPYKKTYLCVEVMFFSAPQQLTSFKSVFISVSYFIFILYTSYFIQSLELKETFFDVPGVKGKVPGLCDCDCSSERPTTVLWTGLLSHSHRTEDHLIKWFHTLQILELISFFSKIDTLL